MLPCRPILLAITTCLLGWLTATGWAQTPPLKLAIDAEFGVRASTSAQAIQRGAEIAAAEINAAGGVLGRPLQIITRNNNSVPARAIENFRELASDPDVIAVMGGKHSPVVQQLLPLIHELRVPYLDPWAAADDITDHGHTPDFVFRLSLKDSWALARLVGAAAAAGHTRLGLLLPNNGWGRSSRMAAEEAVARHPGMRLTTLQWFNFGDQQFASQYNSLRKSGATALLLVMNELEAAALVREIANLPEEERLPIYAHWGLTGGQFFTLAANELPKVRLSVVQSFSFVDARGPVAERVLAALRRHYGVASPRAVDSPVGVAHAYDLTHLLARAIRRAGRVDRDAVRAALERLPAGRGLVAAYAPAFTPRRHDALSPDVAFMARFEPDGAIVRIK